MKTSTDKTIWTDSYGPTPYGEKCNRIEKLNKNEVGIHISEDISSLINLHLLPIKADGKIGFIDKDANLVIEPKYDAYFGHFKNNSSLVGVSIDGKRGIINSLGEYIFTPEYSSIIIGDDQQTFSVEKDRKKALCRVNGDIIVDYGIYSYIDGADSGLVRVKIGQKWGIICTSGHIVLPIEYDNIWNFYKAGRGDTRVEKDGKSWNVRFCDLVAQNKNISIIESHYERYEDESTYSAYDNSYYNDCLDMDQQSMEFWDSL